MVAHILFTTIQILESSIQIPITVICLFFSVIWNVYFVKRVLHLLKLHREYVEKSDPFGNYSAIAYQHRTEIIKYIFMILINIFEFTSSMPVYVIANIFTSESAANKHIYLPNRITISNCTNELGNSKILDLWLIFGNPLNSILTSTAQVGLMLSLAFGICLMK